MKNTINISDFDFIFSGYGHYKVIFTSQITGKKFTTSTNDMMLIDDTKNTDYPKIKDLNELKRLCKS